MTTRQKWATGWSLWLAAFIGLETAALRNGHPDAPLSAHLRWVFGVHRSSKLGKAAYVAAFAWLARHLW